MEEVWKPVEGSDGLYEVSNFGNVRSHTARKRGSTMQPKINRNGYLVVNLRLHGKSSTKSVHRLVLAAFTDFNYTNEFDVRHLDGNPHNNTLDNLAWGTKKENSDDMMRHGTRAVGEKAACKRALNEELVREARRLREAGQTLREIGSKLKVHHSTVGYLFQGKTWKHIPI
jgi:NUMOD4 motif/HNH endonuclease